MTCITRSSVADAEQTINYLLLTEEMGRHMDARRAIYSCLLASLALRLNFSSAQARAQLTIIASNLIAVFNGSRSPDLAVSRLCSASSVYRLLLSACALAQSAAGSSYITAKTVAFSLPSLEPVAIQAMQLASTCLQPFATSPTASSSSSSPPHEMALLLAHASLHFSSSFFSSYSTAVLSGDTSPCRSLVNALVAASASSRWPALADPIRVRALLLLAGVECNAFETTLTPAAAAPDKCMGMLRALLDYPVSLCTALGIALAVMQRHADSFATLPPPVRQGSALTQCSSACPPSLLGAALMLLARFCRSPDCAADSDRLLGKSAFAVAHSMCRARELQDENVQVMKEVAVACARAYCARADILPTAAEHVLSMIGDL